MKKLMIAAAIVCAAAFAQASSFDWKISSMTKVNVMNGTDLFTGTAYLFDAKTYAQNALLDAGSIDVSKAVASGTMVNGVLNPSPVTFNLGADGDQHLFYLAVVSGDNVYVSASVNVAGQQGKSVTVQNSGTNSKLAATEWTKGDTFSKAGWYSTVPEPTSGLLLLLGVAGLALRRRRA